MGEWLCVLVLFVFLGLHLWLVVIPRARAMRRRSEAQLDRERLDREFQEAANAVTGRDPKFPFPPGVEP
jgi:hypothetical protein